VICPTRQISSGCPALFAKIFCFHLTQITGLLLAVREGALRDRHGRWVRDAVDADVLTTNSADADGEVVWSLRPDAGVEFRGNDRACSHLLSVAGCG
jgi:hypothetical protein